MVQRRGFKGRDEDEAKTIIKGSEKNNTLGRNSIENFLKKYGTLGSALYHYQKEKSQEGHKVRIRKRYNLRKDYENELKIICTLHDLADANCDKLHKAIIWQRDLRSQKGLVGKCLFEKGKKRAQLSHPLYEEYRVWININNLKIQPPEGIALHTYLKENIYPLFLRASKEFTFKTIIKKLEKDGAKHHSRFKENTKLVSAVLLNFFDEALGLDWRTTYGWQESFERDPQPKRTAIKHYSYEDIWHVLNTFNGAENLNKFAQEKLNFNDDVTKRFINLRLPNGYATLSLSAIKKMLPYLQKGYLYSHAVYMANLPKVLGINKIDEKDHEHFSHEIGILINKNRFEKDVKQTTNNLIAAELDGAHPYVTANDKPLDESEQKAVLEAIINYYKPPTWQAFSQEEQEEIVSEVGEKFRRFLKISLMQRKDVFHELPKLHDAIFEYLQEAYDIPNKRKKYLWHPSEHDLYPAATEYSIYSLNDAHVYLPVDTVDAFLDKNPSALNENKTVKLLGTPETLTKGFKNPMALKSFQKVRHLINHLLKHHKIDEHTRIVVEIARELNDANKRKAIEIWNNEREKENKKYQKLIIECNENGKRNYNENDKELIRKVRLWEEQGRACLYTGKTINMTDVLNGGLYDIEHTIPASMSFDDELKNLTLADNWYNREIKAKRIPAQLPNYDNEVIIDGIALPPVLEKVEKIFGRIIREEIKVKGTLTEKISSSKIEDLTVKKNDWRNKASWATGVNKDYKDYCIQQAHVLQMEISYLKAKLETFTIKEYRASWKNSQLRDTQIITKYALPYLKTIFNKVSVEKGSVVSAFKEIYELKLQNSFKNRSIHSHHAIDAATLTLTPIASKKILKHFISLTKTTSSKHIILSLLVGRILLQK